MIWYFDFIHCTRTFKVDLVQRSAPEKGRFFSDGSNTLRFIGMSKNYGYDDNSAIFMNFTMKGIGLKDVETSTQPRETKIAIPQSVKESRPMRLDAKKIMVLCGWGN